MQICEKCGCTDINKIHSNVFECTDCGYIYVVNNDRRCEMDIKKIIISIGEKDLELTLNEAKELMDVLKSLFVSREAQVPVIVYPSFPVVPYRYWEPSWKDNEIVITCNAPRSSASA